MVQINTHKKQELSEDLVRHITLDTIRSYNKKFRDKYGELVICCDSKSYWRRDVFPFYKSHRKKERDASKYDWAIIFTILNKIKSELKTYLPYKVIEVDGAEADDIIATLTKEFHDKQQILILSSDKDFGQLQAYDNVMQYSPIMKRFIVVKDPAQFLKEQIIRGDKGDGIPNFLSMDQTFVTGSRQRTISKKKLEECMKADPQGFAYDDVMKRGYSRNQKLIDFGFIPANIQDSILQGYKETTKSSKMNMLNYFMTRKLKNLCEVADEF